MNADQLSTQISKCRALVAGGASTTQVLESLRQWFLQYSSGAPSGRRHGERIKFWSRILIQTLEETQSLGVAVGQLLQEIHSFIRREERLLRRMRGIEMQFGFQAAIALVLPWGVMAFQGKFEWNLFLVMGIVFQIIAIVAFYLLLLSIFRNTKTRRAWVFDYLTAVWMRVSSGLSLLSAVSGGFNQCQEQSRTTRTRDQAAIAEVWRRWIDFRMQNALGKGVVFDSNDSSGSEIIAQTLDALLLQGAPARSILLELLVQIDDDRQFDLEERVAALPVRLSLIFCFCLTPALFLILLGSVWPQLEGMGL